MKKKLILTCLILTLSTSLLACNSTNEKTEVTTKANATSTEIPTLTPPNEDLFESNITKPYTMEQSIANNDLVYDIPSGKYFDEAPLTKFLDDVRNKRATKVRYTQYSEFGLDKMREVEYDGVFIILKEFDTKTPEVPKYYYGESRGTKIVEVSGYYKLDSDGLKLFPLK